jgi:succinyl-diaminopimelate desuccinylase
MTQNAVIQDNEQVDLVEMTQALVRLDSQTPPSDTRTTVDLAAGFFQHHPQIKLRRHESQAPVMNLVAELDGGLPGPRTILSGHIDTYPIGRIADWAFNPLGGEIKNGRLYGRGSADMKGAVAVLIAVMRDFADRATFNGSLVLALAGDEERMGELGTQWLIDNAPEIHGDGVLVADVGGPSAVRIGEKGMLWIDLHAKGRHAHAAHIYAGENAIDRLIAAITALRHIEELHPTPSIDVVSVISAASKLEKADGPEAREVMTRVTMNVGTLQGGTSVNLVPAEARAGLDIRIPIGLTTSDVKAAVQKILENHRQVLWQVTRCYEPTWTDSSAALTKACLKGAARGLGRISWTDSRIGGSDARLWRRAGYPCVAIGLTASNLGAPDESCDVEELGELRRVYTAILDEIHGKNG